MSFRTWVQSWWPPWGKKLNWRNQFKSNIDFSKNVIEGYNNKTYTGNVNLSNIKIKSEGGQYLPPNNAQFADLIKVVNDGTRRLNVSGNALTGEKLEVLYNHVSKKKILLDSINLGSLEECPEYKEYAEFIKVNDVNKIQKDKGAIIEDMHINLPWIEHFKKLSTENTAEELKTAIEGEIKFTKEKRDQLEATHPDLQNKIRHLEARSEILEVFLNKHKDQLDKAIKYENLKEKSEKTVEFYHKLDVYAKDRSLIQTRQPSKIHPVVLQATKPEPLMRPEDLFPKKTKQQESTEQSHAKRSKTPFYDPYPTAKQFIHRPTKRDIQERDEMKEELDRGEKDFEQKMDEIDKHYGSIHPVQSTPKQSTVSNHATEANEEVSEFDPSKPLIISGGPQSMPEQPVIDKVDHSSKQQVKAPIKPSTTPPKPNN